MGPRILLAIALVVCLTACGSPSTQSTLQPIDAQALQVLTASQERITTDPDYTRVVQEAHDTIEALITAGHSATESYARLGTKSRGHQLALALFSAEADMANGGFKQLFHNSTSLYTQDAIAAWHHIGASDVGDIFARALLIGQVQGDYRHPVDKTFRSEYLTDLNRDVNAAATYNELENSYYTMPIRWQVLFGNTIRSQPTSFMLAAHMTTDSPAINQALLDDIATKGIDLSRWGSKSDAILLVHPGMDRAQVHAILGEPDVYPSDKTKVIQYNPNGDFHGGETGPDWSLKIHFIDDTVTTITFTKYVFGPPPLPEYQQSE